MDSPSVTVIGGGFAGVEAAWAAAERGCQVTLHEMRPIRATAVHRSGDLAEPVCSNSLKSVAMTNASGVLKEEMRMLGSVILGIAGEHRVPAGEALAVDRVPFAAAVTAAIEAHPRISLVRGEVTSIPGDRPVVVATGPLTSEPLADSIRQVTGQDALHFFDAVAPTITLDSIDRTKVFRASRRGRSIPPEKGVAEPFEEEGDYLNCFLERDEYFAFYEALVGAELAAVHNPEDAIFFDKCMPVEEIARRGPRTLAFGPMRPIGMRDPRTGRGAYAVVQLRQENRDGTLWGLVGFQTRLKWPEQQRVFRMLPGLENAEFVRYGVIHRNTYVCSPMVLEPNLQLREHPGLLLAGQMTGVEGYLESAATGILAGINAARICHGEEPVVPPRPTMMGSLCAYLVETEPKRFAPMNANFGIAPDLPYVLHDKREKARRKAAIAVEAMTPFAAGLQPGR